MRRLSVRFSWHLIAIATLVSIPVYLHSNGRSFEDDCANPEGLRGGFDHQTEYPVVDKLERPTRAQFQWTGGMLDLAGEGGTRLEFAIARSYIPSFLYTSWTKFSANRIEPESVIVRTLDVDGDSVPVRVLLATDTEPAKIALYMLVYRHRATATPFVDQFVSVVPEFFSTLPPMTIFFVSGDVPRAQLKQAEERSVGWLKNAWRQYRAACVP